jgi:hypothetical protein
VEPEEETVGNGGEAACLAARLCPECGAVLSEDPHRSGCPAASTDAPGR